MTERDIQKFSDLMTTESMAYPQTGAMNGARIGLYFESLMRFGLDDVKGAFKALRERNKFFPTVAEIVEILQSSTTDRAEIAWRTFQKASEEGEMVSAYFYDKGMAYAVESWGGWLNAIGELREASPEMMASYEKRFKASYRLASDNSTLCKIQYFSGHCEMENCSNLQALSLWSERVGCKELVVKFVAVATDAFTLLNIPFNPQTMLMMPEAKERLLNGGQGLSRYLPAASPIQQRALPEAKGEYLTVDQKRELINSIRQLAKGDDLANSLEGRL